MSRRPHPRDPHPRPARGRGLLVATLMVLAASGCQRAETFPPQVVAVDPAQGATGVDPARSTLSVSFDREMSRESWSWVMESPATAPQIVGEPRFDDSGRVQTAEVKLEPGHTYVLWINSVEHSGFRDLEGLPAIPYRWTFSTAGEPGGMLPSEPPAVVDLEPEDGASSIAPGPHTLRVTFDRAMRPGWSWVMESPETFPEPLGEPSFTDDRRTSTLEVRLEPETTYVIWLNSDEFQMFQSEDGTPLAPRRWSFTTAAAR